LVHPNADVVATCISNLKKNKAALLLLLLLLKSYTKYTKYSKRRKFRPKMRQNAFGGRAQPGPAEGASALPQTSEPQLGGGLPTYHGEGREGMGKGKEGDGKGKAGRARHVCVPINK